MVITKAVSQRILVAASIISLLLIAGSIYLHLQQKHHLGRMNLNDSRVRPTDGVENLSKDDVIYVPTIKTVASPKPDSTERKYDYIYSYEDYVDDAPATTAVHVSLGDGKSTTSYITDNDYNANVDGDVPPIIMEYTELDKLGLDKDCLRCLCTTVNGCKPIRCAHIDPCGIYGISKYYWLDGGKPKTGENLNDYDEENEEHRDYLRCVNTESCGRETIKNYIKRYKWDCNNDGIIDCQDHIALHILGPSGCRNKQLSAIHKIRMKSCLNELHNAH